MKLFVYPQLKDNQLLNPYVKNMERALGTQFKVVHPEYRLRLPQPLRLLLSSFSADVYVFNWIETASTAEGDTVFRAALKLLVLRLLLIRKAKIVWIFHNIHPHEGESKWSQRIKRFLFKNSTLIISHSKEAADFAGQYAKCPVQFKNHPIKITDFGEWKGEVRECDYYLWGNVLPYKGIVEFISNPCCSESKRKVLIVGKCTDNILKQSIERCCNENIVFENRRPDFNEVAAQCLKAKYVLFPYVGESVSSSGALMDTLLMGGTPVGPNRGAFADLAKENCCIVYDNINDVFKLPINEMYNKIPSDAVSTFIKQNSWNSFGEWFYETMMNMTKM